jgi:micrococcal nuclease
METHLKVSKVLDGDSLIVVSAFGKTEKEIRLYGLDCPENKYNRKLREVEKKSHIAGELLLQMGRIATQFVLKYIPPGTPVTIITEEKNPKDFYGRQLAYVILPDGECLNDILIREGYAKAEDEYFCSRLAEFQALNFHAIHSKSGLYSMVKHW